MLQFFSLLIFDVFLVGGFLIGEPCKYDENCLPENSYCEMQQICTCKENFVTSDDGETCIALVGAYCHSKYDCSTLPNSICKEDRCVCDKNFIADSSNSKCMPVAKYIKAVCEKSEQCQKTLGEDSYCNHQKECVCRPNYHFSGKCILSRHLDESCRNNFECYIGEDYMDIVHCNNGICSCKDGHIALHNICVNTGSQYSPMPLFSVLIGVMIFLGISR